MSRSAVVISINGDAAQFNNELKKVEKETKDISASIGKVAAASSLGFAALATAIGLAVNEYREGAKVSKSVEQTIRSTGGAAGVTADEVEKLSLSLQKVTNFGDETISTVQGIFLGFKNLKENIFPQVTELALDMAQKFGSAEAAAEFLGKALNNPIRGMNQLRREGIVFTADQKSVIENLVRTGQVAEAQALLLEKVAARYGGQAKAAADPLIQLREVTGDIVQVIGGVFAPAVESAAKALKSVAFYLLEVNPTLIKIGAYALGAGAALLGLTAILTTGALIYLKVTAIWVAYSASAGIAATATGLLTTATSALGAVFAFVTGPIGLTIIAIAALGAAVYYWWDNIKAFIAGVTAEFQSFMGFLGGLVGPITDIIAGMHNFDPAKVAESFEKLKAAWAKGGYETGAAFTAAYNQSLADSKLNQATPEGETTSSDDKRAKLVEDAEYEVEVDREKKKQKLDLEQQYTDELFKLHEEAQQLELNQEAYKAVESARIDLEEKQRRLKDEAKYGKSYADTQAFFRQQNVQGTADMLTNLSSLTRTKNKELFAIGKAAAFANAIMSTAQGVTKTLAEYPFPINIPFALAVGAAGAVQIATISGTTLNAAKGMSGSGSPFGESMVSTFTPREIVVPERFSEGIKKGEFSLSSAKDQAAESGVSAVHVTVGFADDAVNVLEVKRIENRKLGIGIG